MDYLKQANLFVKKMLGGGMRQAGIITAAGIFVLKNNIERLAVDHENAAFLSKRLSEIEELYVSPDSGETNMVFIRTKANSSDLKKFMKIQGLLISHGQVIPLDLE